VLFIIIRAVIDVCGRFRVVTYDAVVRWQMAVYKEDFENERRDKERALSEKDSLIKQTKTLLNEVRALQDRVSQLRILVTFRCILLLLVWHAPLGVRSAKRRHQSPEWTILSHSYRLIQ